MRRLDRYVLRELIVPFLIGTVAVTLMYQANTLIFLQKTFNLQGVPISAIAQLLLYKTPDFLNQTLPVGVALATSLAFSRLARESELTAMRSAGASLRRILVPVAFFGAMVGVGSFLMVEKVMPGAERRATKSERDLFAVAASPQFKSNVALTLDKYSAFIGSVSREPNNGIRLANVVLFEAPRPDEVWIYKADSGVYQDGNWRLENAIFYQLRGVNLLAAKPVGEVKINERMALEDFFTPPQATEETSTELRDTIHRNKLAGLPTQTLEVAYQTRFSVPAACIVFALVAPIFAIAYARTGGFVGVLLSIILVFAYWNVYVISTDILGRNSTISPLLAAWAPNVLFVAFGLIGLRRLE